MAQEAYELQDWYASEAAKRSLGSICQAVNKQGETVNLLGTARAPLLVLADADLHPPEPGEVEISIDEAKADWSAVTTAAAIYGTQFRIRGQSQVRAVLFRHSKGRHPAERYLRSSSGDANRIAQQIEDLAKEVRMLGQRVARLVASTPHDLAEITGRLGKSADVIDRRFRQLWADLSMTYQLPSTVTG